MEKKIIIIKNIILTISICLYLIIIYNSNVEYIEWITYERCTLFLLLLCLFIFSYGLIRNDKKVYKNNATFYILISLLLLGSLTFFVRRNTFKLDFEGTKFGQYELFYTIKAQLERGSKESILKNIIGNLVILIPFSFLLMIKSKKFNNIFYQSLIVLPLIFGIELLQMYSGTGAFDVDDILLNYLGALLFTFLITRFHIIDKIRKIFYSDFNLKYKTKKVIFYILGSLVLFYNVIVFLNFL